MGTIIQYPQRSKAARQQRWERLARAEQCERYGELTAQGMSQRQAAKVLDVPRSTLQAWRTYQEHLDEHPAVVAFFHSVPGLAFLHRLILGLHVVLVEVGACGIRLVCLLLQLTGLERFVGASYGTQQQVNRRVEEAIGAYRHEESTRLAREMPAKDITLPQAAPFPGGLSLVGIEPVSNYILLEQAAQARAHDTWHTLLEQALAGLNCRVIQATSDEAPGLLAYGAQHLSAQHSPDLFHVQHELSTAVTAPLAGKQRAAAKAVAQAEETLKRGHAHLANANGEPAKRGPGRPPKAPPGLEQAAQDVASAHREHQRLTEHREQVTQSIRGMGHAYHFVDLERGVRRNGQLIAGDSQRHIDTLRTIAQQEHLSATCLERSAKAERVVPKMQATIAFVSGYVRQQVRPLDLGQPES
jgi:uncharacterized protein (UPF0548 family)